MQGQDQGSKAKANSATKNACKTSDKMLEILYNPNNK